jgi:hypothetical protein
MVMYAYVNSSAGSVVCLWLQAGDALTRTLWDIPMRASIPYFSFILLYRTWICAAIFETSFKDYTCTLELLLA